MVSPAVKIKKPFATEYRRLLKHVSDDVMPKARNWGQTYAGQNAAEKEFTTAMVVHGGTIMAILSKWAMPHQDYFYWQVKNGCGYLVCLDTDEWLAEKGSLSVIEKF